MDMTLELLSPIQFFLRLLRHLGLSIILTVFALSVGAVGYHFTDSLNWLDSFFNASMILTGMGPVAEMHTVSAKIFAMCYALFSGIYFVSVSAILVFPVAHRLLKHVTLQAMHRPKTPQNQE